jgi:hypothetical protein
MELQFDGAHASRRTLFEPSKCGDFRAQRHAPDLDADRDWSASEL